MATREEILEELMSVVDPELNINIVDLGLVYRVQIEDDSIEVDFTLTYPGCPAGEMIQQDIIETVQKYTGMDSVIANLVWEPLWQPEFMTEEARISLGYPI